MGLTLVKLWKLYRKLYWFSFESILVRYLKLKVWSWYRERESVLAQHEWSSPEKTCLRNSFKHCHRLQSDTDKWRLYLSINFELDLQQNCWDFGLEKKNSFWIVKIMNNFCIFNSSGRLLKIQKLFIILTILKEFFFLRQKSQRFGCKSSSKFIDK